MLFAVFNLTLQHLRHHHRKYRENIFFFFFCLSAHFARCCQSVCSTLNKLILTFQLMFGKQRDNFSRAAPLFPFRRKFCVCRLVPQHMATLNWKYKYGIFRILLCAALWTRSRSSWCRMKKKREIQVKWQQSTAAATISTTTKWCRHVRQHDISEFQKFRRFRRGVNWISSVCEGGKYSELVELLSLSTICDNLN